MKKLSLLIAAGCLCLLSIAKPAVNATQFESYSQQMQMMAAKYNAEKKFDFASRMIDKWLESYNKLSDNDKSQFKNVYAILMIENAKALTQKNEHFNALSSLKKAIKSGYTNTNALKEDEQLMPLHTYSEFDKILKLM
jgi:hypothetical protein